jgi:hypothetical protein
MSGKKVLLNGNKYSFAQDIFFLRSQKKSQSQSLVVSILGRVGFEPTMIISTDLQSVALNRSAIFPEKNLIYSKNVFGINQKRFLFL